MHILDSVRRFFEAIVTALAVVFDLQPDPTAVPVEVHTHPTRRSA